MNVGKVIAAQAGGTDMSVPTEKSCVAERVCTSLRGGADKQMTKALYPASIAKT